jgi:hypothetical protein
MAALYLSNYHGILHLWKLCILRKLQEMPEIRNFKGMRCNILMAVNITIMSSGI